MSVWFARRASQNINANDGSTWNDKADGTGNWLTWANLAAGDVLCANGNAALLINVSLTCLRISTAAEVGASDTGAAGGGFTVTGAVTVTANVLAGSTPCIVSSGTGYTWNVIGSVTGGDTTGAYGIYHFGAHTLNITGNVTGGSGSTCRGVFNASSGTTNIAGNVTGGSGTTAEGVRVNTTGVVVITGDIEGGTSAPATYAVQSGGSITVIGNILNTAGKFNARGGFSGIYAPGASNYIRCPFTSGSKDYPEGLAAGDIRSGVVSGTVTGTHAGGGVRLESLGASVGG